MRFIVPLFSPAQKFSVREVAHVHATFRTHNVLVASVNALKDLFNLVRAISVFLNESCSARVVKLTVSVRKMNICLSALIKSVNAQRNLLRSGMNVEAWSIEEKALAMKSVSVTNMRNALVENACV